MSDWTFTYMVKRDGANTIHTVPSFTTRTLCGKPTNSREWEPSYSRITQRLCRRCQQGETRLLAQDASDA